MDRLDPLRQPSPGDGQSEPELPRMGDQPSRHDEHQKPQPFRPGRQQVGREGQPFERGQHIVGEHREPQPGGVGAGKRDKGTFLFIRDGGRTRVISAWLLPAGRSPEPRINRNVPLSRITFSRRIQVEQGSRRAGARAPRRSTRLSTNRQTSLKPTTSARPEPALSPVEGLSPSSPCLHR